MSMNCNSVGESDWEAENGTNHSNNHIENIVLPIKQIRQLEKLMSNGTARRYMLTESGFLLLTTIKTTLKLLLRVFCFFSFPSNFFPEILPKVQK